MQPPERSVYKFIRVRDALILIVFGLAVISAYQIATRTRFNVHPDELAHADAFCYFENHFWPPDLNANGLSYCTYGWSRVYDRQLVYLFYGQLSHLVQMFSSINVDVGLPPQTGADEARIQSLESLNASGTPCNVRAATIVGIYRMFNIVLFFITLLVLFLAGRVHPWAWLIGLTLLCLPQVIYIYSYANSDAWGLSMSIFLFVFVLTRLERLFRSWWNLFGLAALTGLVILSKETFWFSLPFTLVLVGWSLYLEWRDRQVGNFQRKAFFLIGIVVLIFLIVAPLRVYYPLSQGNFAARVEAMKEARADQDFKPSHPMHPGFRLASRGVTFLDVITDLLWYRLSVQSFYGLFGYMEVNSPLGSYAVAILSLLLLAGATYGFLVLRWGKIPPLVWLMLLAAPVCALLPVLASLFNSWSIDYQPQGRYLFPALIPLALMLGGTYTFEPRWLRGTRLGIGAVLCGLSLSVVWLTILGSPILVLSTIGG